MIRTDKRLRLARTFIALLLAFIWGNSLLPGDISGAISDGVKAILTALFPGGGPSGEGGGFLIRKLAHFTEFAALGALLMWHQGMLGRRKLPAWLSGTAAACIDESIQRFVPDRGPSLWDVALDSTGVAAGIALVILGHIYCKKHNRRT